MSSGGCELGNFSGEGNGRVCVWGGTFPGKDSLVLSIFFFLHSFTDLMEESVTCVWWPAVLFCLSLLPDSCGLFLPDSGIL